MPRPSDKKAVRGLWGMHLFLLLLVLISVRHFFIPGDVLWTEEGDRLSWHMRLKGKQCTYLVRTGEGPAGEASWQEPDFSMLTERQQRKLTSPRLFHAYVKQVLCPKEKAVLARVSCRETRRLPAPLIREDVDLCKVEFKWLARNHWIRAEMGAPDPDYERRLRATFWSHR